MALNTNLPQISLLRKRCELIYDGNLRVHSDFEGLRDSIFSKNREHISETTLERLWGYSTRGKNSVSFRTADVICRYCGFAGWTDFCDSLPQEASSESDYFDFDSICAEDLEPGERLKIGWQPDRICEIRYLGDNRFVAEKTINAKLQPGDTFTAAQFQLHTPLYLDNLTSAAGQQRGSRYGVGLRNGLTLLEFL